MQFRCRFLGSPKLDPLGVVQPSARCCDPHSHGVCWNNVGDVSIFKRTAMFRRVLYEVIGLERVEEKLFDGTQISLTMQSFPRPKLAHVRTQT
jgi:hypothetical protein